MPFKNAEKRKNYAKNYMTRQRLEAAQLMPLLNSIDIICRDILQGKYDCQPKIALDLKKVIGQTQAELRGEAPQ